MTTLRLAAVDLGATSGRVMAARVGPGHLSLKEVHRFPNGGVPVGGSLFWDVLGIHREVLAGVAEVARTGELHGIGIDSWAVDYGLLDRDGELLGNPYSHRDPRTRLEQPVDHAQPEATRGARHERAAIGCDGERHAASGCVGRGLHHRRRRGLQCGLRTTHWRMREW